MLINVLCPLNRGVPGTTRGPSAQAEENIIQRVVLHTSRTSDGEREEKRSEGLGGIGLDSPD